MRERSEAIRVIISFITPFRKLPRRSNLQSKVRDSRCGLGLRERSGAIRVIISFITPFRKLPRRSSLRSKVRDSITEKKRFAKQNAERKNMSISIGSGTGYDSFISRLQTDSAKSSTSKAASLESKLSASKLEDASDEELMEVCKTFESYLVEKVLEKTKKTLTDSEEEDTPYMNVFGDKLYQEYADQITEHGDLGLAQQLFNAMKRDFGAKIQ